MQEHTPEMLRIIALGFVVKNGADGALTTIGSAIVPCSAFGLERCAMITFDNSN